MTMMMLRELACNPADDRAQMVPITAFVAVLCPLLGSLAACSRRTDGSRTKYQIDRTKTDLVFPVDVARRAMQIDEVIDAKISSASALKPDDGELKIWSSGAGIRTLKNCALLRLFDLPMRSINRGSNVACSKPGKELGHAVLLSLGQFCPSPRLRQLVMLGSGP